MKNKFQFIGILEVRRAKDGKAYGPVIKRVKNLIVNAGLAAAAFQLGDGSDPIDESCIGTGVVAAAVGDVALGTQVDAQTPVFSRVTTVVANDTAQFVSLHTGGVGGWAVTEFGVKTTGGVLFNRIVFAAINLAEANELEFTYKVQAQRVA